MSEIIFDLQRFSNFSNSNSNILISGTSGNDSITNGGDSVTILGGAGNDTIYSKGAKVSVSGGAGKDYIENWGDNVSISGGAGKDYIENWGDNVSISGGAGKDYIENWGDNVSISGGAGNDTFSVEDYSSPMGTVYVYKNGDGSDKIIGFGETNTLLIPNSKWTTTKSGKDMIVTVGDGKITLKGAASLKTVNIVSSAKDIHPVNVVNQGFLLSDTYSSLITGISYRDYINTDYDNVTIKTGNGSDSIYNGGSNVSIDAGADDDEIYNNSGWYSTIDGGAGNDYIYSEGSEHSISGGAGNDILTVGDRNEHLTISGGKDNDIISLGGAKNNLIVYNKGDGNDTVYGYGVSDKISLKGDTVTGASILGNDLTLNMSSGGSIRFVNTKCVNVNGTAYGDISTNGTSGNDNITNFASNTTINALGGNDKISNSGENVLIKTNAGKNNIKNYGAQSTITTGSDNDTIYNRGSNTKINSGAGNDSVANYASDVTIDGGAGKNSLESFSAKNVSMVGGTGTDYISANYGENVTIDGGAGNDYLYGGDSEKISMVGGAGNDYIYNSSGNSTVDAGAGDDVISNAANNVSISMGDGNDSFFTNSDNVNVTVLGGKGNDTFSNYYAPMGMVYVYKNGDGNDLIKNLSDSDTILISDSKWTTTKSGKDIIVTVGKGNITLKNAASLETVNIVSSAKDIHPVKVITNDKSNTVIKGTDYSDHITNSLYNTSSNKELKNVTINAGAGNDIVFNIASNNVSMSGGEGNDYIYNDGASVTIDVGAGNDYIENYGSLIAINAGVGNDYIYSYGEKVTINAGAGNDTIDISYSYGDKVLFKYADGDGNDLITGFNETSTLNISGSSYSTAKSGDNIIVTVGNGKITLDGAASLSVVNIVKEDSATNTWKLSGTTATYGTASKTLVTVKGVNSTAGLSIKGKVVTVAQAALNNSNVTVSNGYTLALASDVVKKATTSTDWSYKDSVATYAQTTTAYYTLAGNKKSITYKKATSKNLAKISGVKSKDGLSVSGNVITVPNKIIKKNVTVNGKGYKFKFAADNTSITGSSNVDKIINSGNNVTITGGKGNDIISLASGAKNNVISYSNNDGNDIIYGFDSNDTIKIAKGTAATSISGDDVIFTVGKGKITVKGAKNKTFAYSDAGGNKIYSTVAPSPADNDDYTISPNGKGITLSGSYSSEEFDVTTVKNGGDKIVTINAVAITHKLKIKGNNLANAIIGGKGNDTLRGEGNNDILTGGKGSDVFIYYDGDGNDVITDYEKKDTIVISGSVTPSTLRSDVVLNVGKGKITIQDAFEDGVGITYKENGIEHDYLNGEQTVIMNEKKTTATVTKNYWKDSFDFANFGKSIHKVDASAFTHELNITGNDKANQILGGSGQNTLTGGTGNDTLQGGDKADVFVYNKGDGNDVILGYGESDIISITAGAVDNVTVKNETVILTVGKGKISIDGAAGETNITYYDANGRTSKIFSKENTNVIEPLWFAENNFTGDNQLSSLVQNKATDCSFMNTSTKLSKETSLIAYAKK